MTRPSNASEPNVDTSEWWAKLRWDWIYHSAIRATRRHGDKEDVAHDIALAVVERLALGVPERYAYKQAESIASNLALRDRLCGLTGHENVVSHLQSVARGETLDTVPARGRSRVANRLTKGDRAALAAFLRRVWPDAVGKGARNKVNTARRLVEGVLFGGKSHALMADELGLTVATAATLRARVLTACYRRLAGEVIEPPSRNRRHVANAAVVC